MLKLNEIVKVYGEGDNAVTALDNVTLNFRNSEFVAILGPSGCGKTTLLNIIGGLDRYTSGDLDINNVSTKHYTDKNWDSYRNRSVGFVFQTYNLIPHQTVLENVELALTIGGVSKKERAHRAQDALEKVGLADQINKKPNQLSGGQMQRVAIARALVNNPEIILADEPTGALDTTTSIQVLDLLKEIAQDRLVVMVTHNEKLAERYATRVVSLLDGKVVDDSMPYTEISETKPEQPKGVKMSLGTAFKLSIKNLFSKRTRTFLTSFAGSIGIIGIALVLAVSNGFNMFMQDLQVNSLGDYPIRIYSSLLNSEALNTERIDDIMSDGQGTDGPQYPDIAQSGIKGVKGVSWSAVGDVTDKLQHQNIFTEQYLQYLQDNITPSMYEKVVLNRGVNFNMFVRKGFAEQADTEVLKINVPFYSMSEMAVTMDVSKFQQYVNSFDALYKSVNWQQMLKDDAFISSNYNLDMEFIAKNYDCLASLNNQGFPDAYNEVALVVDGDNAVDQSILTTLGFTTEQIDAGFGVDDFMGKKLVIVPDDAYYEQTTYTVSGTNPVQLLQLTPKSDYTALYNSNESTVIELTITSIVRAKDSAVGSTYDTGIIYTPMLTGEVMRINEEGEIAQQLNSTDIKGLRIMPSGYIRIPTLTAVKESINGVTPTEDWAAVEKMFALNDMPTSITIFAKDFDSKTQIIRILDQYNEGKSEEDQILFSDTTGMLTGYMGVLIDGVSYVLITFAAISLVVSSIMIGIITYVSVVERTREIGVLRSLGASKRDVGTVFIAETFMVGFTAGLIGIAASYLLSLVINLIMSALAPALSTLAVLNPLHALLLVVISFLLTVIAGIIPARIASQKDPVIALRTE